MRIRTEMCAASFVLVLMYAASPGARQNERGQAIDTGSLSARGAVVATGLDNPRGLDWSHGWLFIAEAGTGGDGSCIPGIFAPEICLGRTGSVSVVTPTGRQRRIFDGLPSLAGPDGTFAYGLSDLSVKDGRGSGAGLWDNDEAGSLNRCQCLLMAIPHVRVSRAGRPTPSSRHTPGRLFQRRSAFLQDAL